MPVLPTLRFSPRFAVTFVSIFLCALLLVQLVNIGVADAGTYEVDACESAPGYAQNSWWSNTNGGMAVQLNCPNEPSGHRWGIGALAPINAGTFGMFSSAFWQIDAPAGTTINSATLNYDGYSRPDRGWDSFVTASTDGSFSGGLTTGSGPHQFLDGCTSGSTCGTYGGGTDHYFSLPGRRSLRIIVGCEAAGGCDSSWVSGAPWPNSDAFVALHSARVVIEDDNPPTFGGEYGLWTQNGWVHGTQSVGYSASDASGVKIARIEVDPGGAHGYGWPVDDQRACDFTRTLPCPQSGTSTNLNTATVSDGTHTLRFAAMDPAGNWDSEDHTIHVDNTTPGRPSTSVDGGEGWHTDASPSFTMRWKVPGGQAAPITAYHYELCNTATSACTTGQGSEPSDGDGAAESATGSFGITQPGDYTLKVWLEDAAGNQDSNQASDPVHLKWDNVPPGAADPAHANGWLNAQEATSYPQWVQLVQGGQIPVSGIAGYAVTSDGSDPGTTIDAPGDANGVSYTVSNLPEGHNTIKARAISGAGLASASIKSVDVPVDKTPPTVAIGNAPDPAAWQNRDVTFTVTGTDQPGLSGMDGATAGQPVTSGAYIDYSIDGGPDQQARGGIANVTITGDGVHHVTYQAYDVAGNPSSKQSLDVRMDKTAPELVVFEGSDPNDPARISVAASDRTSGIADGGTIQMRLVAPVAAKLASVYQRHARCARRPRSPRCRAVVHYVRKALAQAALSDWQSLPTSRVDDHFIADLTPAIVPQAGLYEFRALVQDKAGNQAVGSTWRDGTPVERFVDPAKLNGPNGQNAAGSATNGGSGSQGVHCFGCPSYPSATVLTKLTAGLVVTTVRKSKAKRPARCKAHGIRRKRACKRARRTRKGGRSRSSTRLVSARVVPFGKTAGTKGTLTYEDGRGIPSAVVDVYAKLNATGAHYEHVGAVRTNASGAFSYTAPAGPSRSLGFRYDGTATDKATEASVALKVPAASTIKVSRKRLRVGQSVTLTGRLGRLGAPLPSSGKLIVLEAFDRRRWRKFATVRAKPNGSWRYRYRFVATRGTVTYPMRAVIERESSYAFETGNTKPVKVTVSGH